MRYFFIDHEKATNPVPVICGTDAKHIKNVLRLKSGDKIGLFDGTGFEYEARILAISPGGVEVSIIKSFSSTSESPVQIIMAQALLKDRKMDNLVRQLTELGITRWIPFFAQRSISRPDEKRLLTREKRWKKIAQEAVKQCKRGRKTEIDSINDFMLGSPSGHAIILILFLKTSFIRLMFIAFSPIAFESKCLGTQKKIASLYLKQNLVFILVILLNKFK